MRSSKLYTAFAVAGFLNVAAAFAAHVDMKDPRRATGRDDDIRIDAELVDDTVAFGSTVGVTYEVENLTPRPIAVADKVCDVSYDDESRTITISVGSEVPNGGAMPRLVTIASGQKKTFTCGGLLRLMRPASHSQVAGVPRFVQITVNVLRDLGPFVALIERQASGAAAVELTDQQFDQWLQSNDSILLNVIPVHFGDGRRDAQVDASQPHS